MKHKHKHLQITTDTLVSTCFHLLAMKAVLSLSYVSVHIYGQTAFMHAYKMNMHKLIQLNIER